MMTFILRKKCCNPTHRTRVTAFLLNGKNAILNWPPLLIATLLRGLSWFFVIRITSPNIPPSGALSRQIIPKISNFHYGPRTIDKLLNFAEMKFSSQRTFKSEVQDQNFLIGLVKILYYPIVTNLMRAPKARFDSVYGYKQNAHRRRASKVTNEVSISNIYSKTCWPPSMT